LTGVVLGRRATFCGPACRDAFREDRRHGLIYGPSAVREDDGRVRLSLTREAWSLATGCCAYCSTDTARRAA
jgi:hypothetical protein